MWATERHPEHEGIVGVTFDSEGNRLVGTLYLARGEEPKPTVLLLHGCPGLEKNLDLAMAGHSMGAWAAIVTASAEPRLRAVAVYGAPSRLGAGVGLDPEQVESEFTRFLAATPAEFADWLDEACDRELAGRGG